MELACDKSEGEGECMPTLIFFFFFFFLNYLGIYIWDLEVDPLEILKEKKIAHIISNKISSKSQ